MFSETVQRQNNLTEMFLAATKKMYSLRDKNICYIQEFTKTTYFKNNNIMEILFVTKIKKKVFQTIILYYVGNKCIL